MMGSLSAWPESLSSASASATQALTLEAALALAQERSQALIAQAAAVRSAQQQAVAAAQLPDPVLQLALSNLPVEGSGRWQLDEEGMTMQSIGMMQTFTRQSKRDARRTRFEREAELATHRQTAALAQLQRDTALAWLEHRYRLQQLHLLQTLQTQTRQQVAAVEAAYRSKQGTQAAVLNAHLQQARVGDRIAAAQVRSDAARQTLQRWIGDAAPTTPGPLPEAVYRSDALHQAVHEVDAHPELQTMQAARSLALAEVDRVRADRQADPSLSVMVAHRSGEMADLISLGVSLPIRWDQPNRQDRQVQAALARADQADAELEEMRRAHVTAAANDYRLWQSLLQRLTTYERTLIPLASEQVQAATAAYAGGDSALASIFEAHRQETELRLERLELEWQAAATWAELAFLTPTEDQP
jgi:outer membrane protein TolC